MALEKPVWQVFKGEDGGWYFHLRAKNGELVLASESYKNKADAIQTVELITEQVFNKAEIVIKSE